MTPNRFSNTFAIDSSAVQRPIRVMAKLPARARYSKISRQMAGRISDFAEGVFQDVAGLVYGAISTVACLIASPLRGPLRLAMRRRRINTTQIAPHISSFLAFGMLFFAIASSDEEVRSSIQALPRVEAVPPSVQNLLIGAFVATIVFDAVLRVVLVIKDRRRPARRRRMLSRLLYSSVVQCVAIALGLLVVTLARERIHVVRTTLDSHWYSSSLSILVLYLAASALGAVFFRITQVGRQWWRVGALQVAFTFVGLLAVVTGLIASSSAEDVFEPPVFNKITCRVLQDGQVELVMFVRNDRQYPLVLEPKDVTAILTPYDLQVSPPPISVAVRFVDSSAGQSGQPYYIFRPREIGWVRYRGGPSSDAMKVASQFTGEWALSGCHVQGLLYFEFRAVGDMRYVLVRE